MVTTYSLRKDGEKYLSKHFKVKEFRCRDGSDTILIDDGLIEHLQAIRNHFASSVVISSGYRTPEYNRRVGGATKSQHLYGTAADLRIQGVSPRDIARWVELNRNPGGLGLYDYPPGDKTGFVHVDTRSGKPARWVQTSSKGSARTVGSIVEDYLQEGNPTLRKGNSGEAVLRLKKDLIALGYAPFDNRFDDATEAAVKEFQRAAGLSADGIVGTQTWKALEE